MKKKTNKVLPFIAKADEHYKFDKESVRKSMKTAFYQDDREEFAAYIKYLSKK